jgi:chromosome segregation protein
MHLRSLEINGFKSFAKKTTLVFDAPITSIVGPNGSGKSNVAESIRWVLGEQSMKSLRGKRGEDLIFNGAASAGRQNRAAVSLSFDNSKREFATLEFDEVTITREVFRDGSNNYLINGSVVRLRDVLELLSAVSLGPTGHHIISQGEADRILNANLKERREMLEDALGLKIYQFKISESEKRLEKTEENIKQVESLRREIAPHLKFLRKQVEEAEKLNAVRADLEKVARDYFGNEEKFLTDTKGEIQVEINNYKQELTHLAKEIKAAEAGVERADRGRGDADKANDSKKELENKIANLRRDKDGIMKALGKLEGKLEAVKVEEFVIRDRDSGKDKCRYCGQEITRRDVGTSEQDLAHLAAEKKNFESQYQQLGQEEGVLLGELENLHRAELSTSEDARAAERVLHELRSKRATAEGHLATAQARESAIRSSYETMARESHEVASLVGTNVMSGARLDEDRAAQVERRKRLERLKIKLEDAGGVGTEVIKEYEDTSRRDEYLVKELADLEASKKSLRELLKSLSETLEAKFKSGLIEVNHAFEGYFSILFGGGNASLKTVQLDKPAKIFIDGEELDPELGRSPEGGPLRADKAPSEWGIDINVSLPRKKIKGLDMLSGGERALTSIALLFAMSQVNPPPFLVLDETDAALDEANARKYGQMLKTLSSKSQLIVVTHNRETMSHADILYGVTMGSDGISKLLSIRFDDATVYAK